MKVVRTKLTYGLEALAGVLAVLFLFPIYLVLINSGKSSFEITANPTALPADWMQIIRNMQRIWSDPNILYGSSFQSSVIITVFSLLLVIVISGMAAWVLVRTKSTVSNIIFLVMVAAMVIPFQIVMLPLVAWFRLFHQVTGILLLRTYHGMILAYIGFGLSLSVFILHGFIKGIPYELEEAAIIDGCSKPAVFFRIVFPLLRPVNATILILHGIWIWNDYLLPLIVLGRGNRIQTIPLAVANFAGAYVKQWDLILTSILMAMIPVIIVFLFAQKHIMRGIIAGSIK
ncbi:carbohydrate ABC transporter permease [Spirochaeta africana]|uniref:ABC-type sugar transport system, permease component n=1 Tax=Spirochaeta africana (strain ATCC 700263 / DSM 8902 / Z-7692) TaxID=889378 RepID=H9UL93_SPIAZ|nr:carbohydrate ABC transporter permease [Spirochaeta africana]AFG38286.1 ABC-type sugar transport system, permease component [Spirochaeta africana DSM 8902]